MREGWGWREFFFGAEGIFEGRVSVALEAPGKIGTAACKNEVVDGVDSLVGSCSGQALQYVSAMADDSLVGLDSFHVMAWAITGYVFHSTFTIDQLAL
uniref:OSJNBb0013J13.14 protein n=1 Tax=Oryza sativa subsp. japonica TaxID=39947 RepID=Q7XP06_ORYSJ|nr:OSJNBb0013J13.14 [Oryza sativa Japonica Group]